MPLAAKVCQPDTGSGPIVSRPAIDVLPKSDSKGQTKDRAGPFLQLTWFWFDLCNLFHYTRHLPLEDLFGKTKNLASELISDSVACGRIAHQETVAL
jgi:hypothetical protein